MAAPNGHTVDLTLTYRFDRPVALGEHCFRIHPRPDCPATVTQPRLAISPVPTTLGWVDDDHGNRVALAGFSERTTELELTWSITVHPAADHDDAGFPDPASPPGVTPGAEMAAAAVAADAAAAEVATRFEHVERHEPGVQDPNETEALGTGSCRDLAWLLVERLRAEGHEARYVAGWLLPDGADPVLHAWGEVRCAQRWLGVDATTGRRTGPRHVPLACGPTPEATALVSGTTSAAAVTLTSTLRSHHDLPLATSSRPKGPAPVLELPR